MLSQQPHVDAIRLQAAAMPEHTMLSVWPVHMHRTCCAGCIAQLMAQQGVQ
jgi:hypothetical protein